MADYNLNEVNSILINLQNYLKEKFDLQQEVENLPIDLNVLKGELEAKKDELDTLNSNLDFTKQEEKSLNIKYNDTFHERSEVEKKIELTNTHKEHEAIMKEIDNLRKVEKEFYDSRNITSKTIEDLSAVIAALEEEINAIQNKVNEDEAVINTLTSEKEARIAELDGQINDLINNNIDPALFKKFSNIVKNKDGVGIVDIEDQVCNGCHMILPKQFVNDVRLNEETKFCPYCSRILYYSDGAEEDGINFKESEFDDVLDI